MSGFVACDEHPDKTIETYCKDHSKPCCTVCATVHHRKCEHVVTIEKAVSGVHKSIKAQELMMELKETSNKLEVIIDNRKQSTTNFEKGIDVVLTEIGNMRQTMNDRLDELELKIKEEVKSVRKTYILRLNEEINELVALKSSFDYWKYIFRACLSQGSEIHCLVKMEDISSKMPHFKNDLSTVLQGIRDISIKFETMNIISDTMCFGRLHLKEQKPSLLGKIHVIFTIDVRGAYTSGIFLKDDIIITEYNENRIAYHDNTGKQIDTLEFQINERPTDIIKVNDHTVAASIYQYRSYGKIFIINVKPLTLFKTVNINVGMFGMCMFIHEEIIVNSSIISLSNIEHGAKLEEYHATFVGSQREKKNIFRNTNSIRFESFVGKDFDCRSNLSSPFHQNIDRDGNIYIVEHYAKSILQVTPDGQLARTIALSNIDKDMTERPWVMRFKQNTDKFLVTFHGTRSEVYICEIN
ncbi:unnamed protein product [Mytilus coruscus]|uniref:B box-type domain-containing protein n=1 Tax=Mytilus coruscus TaxID=42192 RepID=A0A6J8ELQ6_MYTCO|nr:unnamed protein product [Mytilus coruscus]